MDVMISGIRIRSTVEPLLADKPLPGGHLSIKDTNVQSQIGHFYSF
jgi:hypothetical protein